MKILILGHTGMLGNCVYKYYKDKHNIQIINDCKWDSIEYKNKILNSKCDFIINCVGAIPQKKYNKDYYELLNVQLPIFLESLNKKIIHPSTDCEFSGFIEYPNKYKKTDNRDAMDDYGLSKSKISNIIENEFVNTKIIRTSIIGHELNTSLSLLDWFLNTEIETNGYINHYWNGITTLQWCEISEMIINNWNDYDKIIQIGTIGTSKFELLEMIKNVYNKEIQINKFKTNCSINKMLESDFEVISLIEQLIKLKEFYKK
jgi:dTDP-4-dehydrorhamnose reductase